MSPIKKKKLDKLRKELDQLDNSLIKIIKKRTDLVKKVLNQVSENGLPDKHHFYITFITHFMGVTMPDIIKNKYPDEYKKRIALDTL